MATSAGALAGPAAVIAGMRERASNEGHLSILRTAAVAAAAAEGNRELFEAVLASGRDISGLVRNFRSKRGESMLSCAAYGKNASIVRQLVQMGVRVDDGGKRKKPTPLSVAMTRGGTAAAAELLVAGANPNVKHGKYELQPLHMAAEAGHAGCVALLVHDGIPAGVPCKWGHTALLFAVKNGHLPVVQFLVESGVKIKVRPCLPSRMLAGYTPDGLGVQSVLEHAARGGRVDLVALLFRHASENTARAACRHSPAVLHFAVSCLRVKHTEGACAEMIRTFVRAGAGANERDASERTALHVAAGQKDPPLDGMLALVKAGAQVNATDSNGNTPLHLASMYSVDSATKLLLGLGADGRIANGAGETASVVVGTLRVGTPRRRENGRIRGMLARNTSWRRRGWAVILRSRQPKEARESSTPDAAEVAGLTLVDAWVGMTDEVFRNVLMFL